MPAGVAATSLYKASFQHQTSQSSLYSDTDDSSTPMADPNTTPTAASSLMPRSPNEPAVVPRKSSTGQPPKPKPRQRKQVRSEGSLASLSSSMDPAPVSPPGSEKQSEAAAETKQGTAVEGGDDNEPSVSSPDDNGCPRPSG